MGRRLRSWERSPVAKAREEKRGKLFEEKVTAGIIAMGATEADDYKFQIETKAGLLYVHPNDTWVACIFEDVERARAFFNVGEFEMNNNHGLNPFCGKWNHMYHKPKNLKQAEINSRIFLSDLRWILPWVPVPICPEAKKGLILEINPKEIPNAPEFFIQTKKILWQCIMTPPIDEDFWVLRIAVSDTQAVVAFPKMRTIGIGFQQEEVSWNTNLPYDCTNDEIYNHIKKNQGEKIPKERVKAAIGLIQNVSAQLNERLC